MAQSTADHALLQLRSDRVHTALVLFETTASLDDAATAAQKYLSTTVVRLLIAQNDSYKSFSCKARVEELVDLVTGWSYLKYSYACGLMAAADPLMLDAIDSVLEGVQPVDVPNNIAEVSFDTLYGLRDGSHLEMMRLVQGGPAPPPPRDEGQRRSKAAVEDAPAQDDMDVDAAPPAKDQTPAPPPPRDEGQRRSKAAVEDAPAQDDMDVDAAPPAKDQTPETATAPEAAEDDAPGQPVRRSGRPRKQTYKVSM